MQDQFRTGSVTVDRMSRLHISGNIIPVTWYKTIRKSNRKAQLKCNHHFGGYCILVPSDRSA